VQERWRQSVRAILGRVWGKSRVTRASPGSSESGVDRFSRAAARLAYPATSEVSQFYFVLNTNVRNGNLDCVGAQRDSGDRFVSTNRRESLRHCFLRRRGCEPNISDL
jgi:hypothetical protein